MTKKTKNILAAALLVVLLAAVAVGLIWHGQHYVMVDFQFYPRNEKFLDLREQELTRQSFQKLQDKLPETRIEWLVPFQGRRYPLDTRELTVETLSAEDLQDMRYLAKLEVLHAEKCTDYDNLQLLRDGRPGLDVRYLISVDGTPYSSKATKLTVSSISDAELENLKYLTQLNTVMVAGCGDAGQLEKLRQLCKSREIAFDLVLGGQSWQEDTRELSAKGVKEEELGLIRFLPELKKLAMVNPEASPASLQQLQKDYPNVEITWEMDFGGLILPSETVEVDLSALEIKDLAQVEAMMEYFPKAEKVILGMFATAPEGRPEWEVAAADAITNEDVAQYRERVRDKYKVVWTVQCGKKLTARTDDTYFRPDSHGVGRFFDEDGYNLRYCEDMICIDIGHMTIGDVSFVAFMPKLKYLILAWTGVTDVTPIGNCKELVFLELDWSPVKDISPLVGCTKLEDLNIGSTYADVSGISEMKWLKNLWMVFCSPRQAYIAAQALPDTRVCNSGNATVSSGWRNLPNYFAMRDACEMYYMKW